MKDNTEEFKDIDISNKEELEKQGIVFEHSDFLGIEGFRYKGEKEDRWWYPDGKRYMLSIGSEFKMWHPNGKLGRTDSGHIEKRWREDGTLESERTGFSETQYYPDGKTISKKGRRDGSGFTLEAEYDEKGRLRKEYDNGELKKEYDEKGKVIFDRRINSKINKVRGRIKAVEDKLGLKPKEIEPGKRYTPKSEIDKRIYNKISEIISQKE